MAIITPSRSFENSDLSSNSNYRYIKPEAKPLVISTKINKDGVHLFFLPSYKADAQGNGVWYKKVRIRRNFGNEKETYYIKDPATDPVAFFERKFKSYFPDEARVTEQQKDGKTFKVFPAYGNTGDRVVFNVLNASNGGTDGAQVLDLPAFNGADQLMKYHNTPDFKKEYKRLVCDPTMATIVFVQMTDSPSPWVIRPDPSQQQPLDPEYTEAQYLHNLDEIFIEKDNSELIDKLRAAFHSTVFDRCMDGFPGLSARVTVGSNPLVAPRASAPEPEPEVVATAPAVARFAMKPPVKVKKEEAAPSEEDDIDTTPAKAEAPTQNPMGKKVGKDEVMAFLKAKQ